MRFTRRSSIQLALLVLAWSIFHSTTASFADISLPSIFSDNMVLQREARVKISGTAEPKQNLAVQLGDTELKTTADSAGNWFVSMPTGAAGGPYELTVTAVEGQPQVKISNVMVGEVWLCCGESNMQWPVKGALNSTREIEQSTNYPNVRLLSVGEKVSRQPLEQFDGLIGWEVCSPDSVGDFSAIAYFFARELSKKFPGMAVGVISAASGGATCEAWTSRQSLESHTRFQPLIEHWDSLDEENMNRPAVLFNGMIAPLKDFPFRGVTWYQGEANVGRGEQYSVLFPTLIKDWRNYFDNEAMPFLFVQLAPFRYAQKSPEALPELWDAQFRTATSVPEVAMVVTTDVGDIEDMHPKNKQEVGRRLSLVAIDQVYGDLLNSPVTGSSVTEKNLIGVDAKQAEPISTGPDPASTAAQPKDLVASGPIYESMVIRGNTAKVFFKHSAGLSARVEMESLTEFLVCGEDRVFHPAEATIVEDTVELSAPEVAVPIAVRLGWSDSSQPNLINGAGLPASPFRTDDFPLLSDGKDF
jgi:sialate O-acetylesterase